jgi:2-keto-4-pentenoate hydratase
LPAKDAEQAARLLVGARRGGHRLAELPEELRPATIGQAYAIQDAIIRQLGPIGGWKVGPRRGNVDPSCAPLSAALIHASPGHFAPGEVPAAEAEVEIAVKLGRDLPPRGKAYGPDDLREAIVAIHPAIELLSSRFVDRKVAAPLSVIADSQSNAAVVLGEELADWRGLDLGRVAMRLRLGGVEVARTEGGPGTEEVLGALAWLADHAAARTGGLKKGDVVITGARVGPWPLGEAATEAEATGLGRVTVDFK